MTDQNKITLYEYIKVQKQEADEQYEKRWRDKDISPKWEMNYAGTEHYIESYAVEYYWTGRGDRPPRLRAKKYAETSCGQRFVYGKKRDFRGRCKNCEKALVVTKQD